MYFIYNKLNFKKMANPAKNPAKKTISQDSVQAKKILNLSSFVDVLSKKEINAPSKNTSIGIYKYNEGEKMSSSTRSKFRRIIESYCDSILLSAKNHAVKNSVESEKDLLDNIEKFKEYYAFRYVVNDFKVESITNSQKDAKRSDYKLMFEIIKQTL